MDERTGFGYCHARSQMRYEQMLEERKCSPASRLSQAITEFDERDGWNRTRYSLILESPGGVRWRQTIICRTLSMMVVER